MTERVVPLYEKILLFVTLGQLVLGVTVHQGAHRLGGAPDGRSMEVFPREVRVQKGEVIAWSGESGWGGPHLHFEEKVGGGVVAPYLHGAKFDFGTSPTSQNCVDVPLAANMNGGLEAEPVYFTRATPATFTIKRLKRSARTIADAIADGASLGGGIIWFHSSSIGPGNRLTTRTPAPRISARRFCDSE